MFDLIRNYFILSFLQFLPSGVWLPLRIMKTQVTVRIRFGYDSRQTHIYLMSINKKKKMSIHVLNSLKICLPRTVIKSWMDMIDVHCNTKPYF